MTQIFPLLIVTVIVVIAGPVAVDWVSDLTLDLAARTAAQVESIK